MSETTHIEPVEFAAVGYLHEVNRLLLHPLGLALEVVTDAAGKPIRYGRVRDERGDPEGIIMGDSILSSEKAAGVDRLWTQRFEARHAALGYMVQPARPEQDTSPWNDLSGEDAHEALEAIAAVIGEGGTLVGNTPADRIAQIIIGWQPGHALASAPRIDKL